MKKSKLLVLAVIVAIVTTLLVVPLISKSSEVTGTLAVTHGPPLPVKKLTHQQEVWISVLEWCESRGNVDAVNKADRDRTPSYGGFQFKPETLNFYARLYGITTTTVMDYEVQHKVVVQMVLHSDEIDWYQQFPDCVKKYGPPPADKVQ